MNRCIATSGFFVLGRCGRAAVAQCARCRRAVCQEHHGYQGLCPECLAATYRPEGPYDDDWVEGYRRNFYRRSSETYQDPSWYAAFDAFDRGAFEPGAGHAPGDFDHDDEDGFVDS